MVAPVVGSMCDAGHTWHFVRNGTALINIGSFICSFFGNTHAATPRRSHRCRTRMLVHASHGRPACLLCAPSGIWGCRNRSVLRRGLVPHDSSHHPGPIRLWVWYELKTAFVCRSLRYATVCPSLDDKMALDTGLQHTQNGLSLSKTSDDAGTSISGRRICNCHHGMYGGTMGGTSNLRDYTAWGYDAFWTSRMGAYGRFFYCPAQAARRSTHSQVFTPAMAVPPPHFIRLRHLHLELQQQEQDSDGSGTP
jgi:hypothetical protein